jgi:PAS domain S-box-containing protein/putative nucleotidyltransferase with HDIG domain
MNYCTDDICINKHVLIVDDDTQNLYLLEMILKNEKCVVTCAGNGLEAFEYLKKDLFHLIISDILMPKMDGFLLCRECKSDPDLKNIPFVFYTADYTSKKDEEFALGLGADRFTIKPVEPVSFMSIIREVFREYEKEAAPSKSPVITDEVPYLRGHNERIVQKLEQKVNELDTANKILAENEQKYRSIFENSIEGIYRTTPEGKFLMANPAFIDMLGYGSYDELVSAVDDIMHQLYANPEDREFLMQMLKKQSKIKAFETQFYKKDRSKIWVSVNVQTVNNQDGNILYYEGIDEDITSRKLAEEELQNAIEKLRKSLVATVKTISSIVEARDPYTAGHQRRVSNLASTIAREMGLSSDMIDNIRMAGIIHDIGKISIPAEILVKPGKLSDIEMSFIKVHPQSGYDMLKSDEIPYPIAEIILQHHEKIDGSGYPNSLKGDQILLEAKIIAVADMVEAMSSHRPYRPAMGIDTALEEIEQNKGILYDEKVVEICLKLFRGKGFIFE